MIIYATILSFVSVTLLVMWFGLRGNKAARARVERELLLKNVLRNQALDELDDATLLRDEKLSSFGPLNALLNGMKIAANLGKLLRQADLRMRVATLLLMMAVGGVLGFTVAYTIHAGIAMSLVVGAMLGSAPYTYVAVLRSRRIRAFEAQFPEAVDLMSRAIRAGHAFSSGIKMVADEMPDPVGKEFNRVFEEQNLGMPMRNALLGLLDRIELVDLKLFVVAVLIQRQSGGNLSEILDKIAYTIRERFRILRQLKVHTAQARMTGIILTALPPVVGAIIFVLNYEYMKIIFTETWGIRILTASLVMQIIGFLWIRKIVNIEV